MDAGEDSGGAEVGSTYGSAQKESGRPRLLPAGVSPDGGDEGRREYSG